MSRERPWIVTGRSHEFEHNGRVGARFATEQRAMARADSVTEMVREGLRIVMDGSLCPTCHNPVSTRVPLRDVGAAIGVSASTLSRFLRGSSIDSDTLDRIYEWVQPRLPAADPSDPLDTEGLLTGKDGAA